MQPDSSNSSRIGTLEPARQRRDVYRGCVDVSPAGAAGISPGREPTLLHTSCPSRRHTLRKPHPCPSPKGEGFSHGKTFRGGSSLSFRRGRQRVRSPEGTTLICGTPLAKAPREGNGA